jgi:hypothetical protein
MKIEAVCSSETSVDFQRATRSYIPEDSTPRNHRCENLKSSVYLYDSLLTTGVKWNISAVDDVSQQLELSTEHVDRTVIAPASYSGVPGRKSQPLDQLS